MRGLRNRKRRAVASEPTITAEAFAAEYARKSGVTVEWLAERGRTPMRCECNEPDCQGWQMARRGADNPEFSKSYLGDGAYVGFEWPGFIVTAENGIETTDRVFLEVEALISLVRFAATFLAKPTRARLIEAINTAKEDHGPCL